MRYIILAILLTTVLIAGCVNLPASLSEKAVVYDCDSLKDTDEKDYCYKKNAVTTKNSDYCNKIKEELTKEFCYNELAKVTGELSFCKYTDYEEFCISDVAEYREEPNLCKHTGYHEAPCYIRVAAKSGDVSVCDSVESETLKKVCIAEANNNELLCIEIEDETFGTGAGNIRDMCVSDIALNKNDPKICKTVINSLMRKKCEADIKIRQISSG